MVRKITTENNFEQNRVQKMKKMKEMLTRKIMQNESPEQQPIEGGGQEAW
jgi:hypothetical protein